MAFLPEEFGGAQEKPRPHFPAHDIGPLVDQHGQVAMAADPAREGVADDGLRGGPHHQRLFQLGVRIGLQLAVDLLQAVMGDDRHFLGEAFDMIGFLGDEGEGDEEREIAILMAGRLDAAVQLLLDQFPHAIAPGLDHHGAAHRAGLGHVGVAHHRLVPVGEAFAGDVQGALHGQSESGIAVCLSGLARAVPAPARTRNDWPPARKRRTGRSERPCGTGVEGVNAPIDERGDGAAAIDDDAHQRRSHARAACQSPSAPARRRWD